MRNEKYIALSTALSLVLLALGFGSAWWELARARRRKDSSSAQFLSPRRTVRRLFTAIVLIGLGVMIWWGFHFLDYSSPGMRFYAYWGVVFLLILWLFLCPLFEWSETRRVYDSRMKDLRDRTIGPLPGGDRLPRKGKKKGKKIER